MRAATEHRVGTADASTTLGPLVGTCCYLLQASALPRFSSSRRVPSSFASESNQPILRPQPFDFPFEGSFDSRSIHHRNPACLRVCVVLATRKQDDTTHSTPQNSSLSHQAFSPSRPFTCLPTPSIKLPSTCARSSELTRQAAPLPHHHHHHHLAAPGRIGTNWRDKKKKKKRGTGRILHAAADQKKVQATTTTHGLPPALPHLVVAAAAHLCLNATRHSPLPLARQAGDGRPSLSLVLTSPQRYLRILASLYGPPSLPHLTLPRPPPTRFPTTQPIAATHTLFRFPSSSTR